MMFRIEHHRYGLCSGLKHNVIVVRFQLQKRKGHDSLIAATSNVKRIRFTSNEHHLQFISNSHSKGLGKLAEVKKTRSM